SSILTRPPSARPNTSSASISSWATSKPRPNGRSRSKPRRLLIRPRSIVPLGSNLSGPIRSRHALAPARGAASPADLPHPRAGRGTALLPQLRSPALQLSLLQRPALPSVRRPGCPAVARGEYGTVAAGELFPGHLHRARGLAPLDSLSSPPGLRPAPGRQFPSPPGPGAKPQTPRRHPRPVGRAAHLDAHPGISSPRALFGPRWRPEPGPAPMDLQPPALPPAGQSPERSLPHAFPARPSKTDARSAGRPPAHGVATTLGGSQRRHRQRPKRSALPQPLRVQNRHRQPPSPTPAQWTVALALSP